MSSNASIIITIRMETHNTDGNHHYITIRRKEIQQITATLLSKNPSAIKKILYVTNRVNPKHYPSKSIANYRRPPQIKTIGDQQLQGVDDDIFQESIFAD
eukprot:1064320_1